MNIFLIILMILHVFQEGTAYCNSTNNYGYIYQPYGQQRTLLNMHTTCYISQLYNNPKNGYQQYNLQLSSSDSTVYSNNIISIIIEDSFLTNFSASTFMSDKIACYYGKIRLLIKDSHVNNIASFQTDIHRTVNNNKIAGPKCNISYESIEFRNNNITKLDMLLFNNLTHLVSLNLSSNHIHNLGKFTFNNLGNLSLLNLSDNNISNIDWAFGKLDKLENLDLSKNMIEKLTKQAFENTTNLKYLNISYNHITAIMSSTFIHLNNLYLLDISHNQVKSLELGAFSGLINLVFMNISNNGIVPDKSIMINMPKLEHLDLSFNGLQYFDVDVFKYLKGINIDGNNFSCQKLIHIIRQFKQMGIKLEFGSEKERLNLFGMHCNNTESIEDVIINLPVGSNSPNDLTNFFSDGFKETSFYKYFTEFSNQKKSAIENEAYADAMKSLEKSSKNIANVLNSTMVQMLLTLQSKFKTDKQQAMEDNTERSKFMDFMSELQTEIKRFDKDSNKVNEIINEKYVQTPRLPVQSHDQNILIVIMCMVAIMTAAVVYNVFIKSYAERRLFNRDAIGAISRTELCSMSDTL